MSRTVLHSRVLVQSLGRAGFGGEGCGPPGWVDLDWVWRGRRLVLWVNGRDVQQVGEILDPVLAPRRNDRFGNLGGNPGDGSKAGLIADWRFTGPRRAAFTFRTEESTSRFQTNRLENAIRLSADKIRFRRLLRDREVHSDWRLRPAKLASDATDH